MSSCIAHSNPNRIPDSIPDGFSNRKGYKPKHESNAEKLIQQSIRRARAPYVFALFALGAMFPSLTWAATTVFSSVLPTSRSVQVGETATLFATVINAGAETAENCRIERDPTVVANFSYQTTNPQTNEPTGTSNTQVDIAVGAFQTFVMSLTTSSEQDVVEFRPRFVCDNATAADSVDGLNTFTFSSSTVPTPDVIALSATTSADGVVVLPQRASANAFTVATVNLGAEGPVRVTAIRTNTQQPVSIAICETDPLTSQCTSPSTPVVGELALNMPAGSTKTFGLFVNGTDDLEFDPAQNRVFVRFTDASGAIRGATSVALRTRPRTAIEPLQIVSSVAQDVMSQPLDAVIVLRNLQRLALEAAINIARFGRTETTVSCSGSSTWQFQDRNADRLFGTGDLLRGTLENCNLGLGARVSGEVELAITSLQPATDQEWALGGQLMITQPLISNSDNFDGDASLMGSFQFNFVRALQNSELVTTNNITITGGSSLNVVSFRQNFALSDFTANLISTDSTFSHSFNGTFSSIGLGGQSSCTVTDASGTFFASTPSSGQLVCTGLNGAQARLTSVDSESGEGNNLEIDTNGSGNFQVAIQNQSWSQLTIGGRPFDRAVSGTLPAPQSLPLAPSAELNIAVSAILYNPVADELYVANSVSLIALDPATLAVRETVSVPGTVSQMALSPDGASLWLGYSDRSEIQQIDVATRTLMPALGLGAIPATSDLFAADIAVDPTDSTRVAVSLQQGSNSSRHAGVVLFQAGAALPNMTSGNTGPNRLAFTDSGRLLGLNTQFSDFAFRELLIDANGLTDGEVLRDFFNSFGTDIFAVGERIVSTGSTPRFVDFDQRRIVGQLVSSDSRSGRGVALDAAANRIWIVGSDVLTYNLENYTLLGRNQTSLSDRIVSAQATPTSIIVAEESRVVVLDRPQIFENLAADCTPTQTDGISIYPCNMADATFNQTTSQFLASLPSSAGAQGNTIAVIDGTTGAIDRHIPVGSEPGAIDLNGDETRLFVALQGSNAVAELSLATDLVERNSILLSEDFSIEPLFARLITSSPSNNLQYLIHTNDSFSDDAFKLSTDGVLTSGSARLFLSGIESIAYSPTDSTTAFATSFSRFYILTLDAMGITASNEITNLFSGDFVENNGLLFSVRGERLDPATLIAEQPFGAINAETVAYQATGDRVLYGFRDGTVAIYNNADGTLLNTVTVPRLSSRQQTSLVAGPQGALITTSNGGAWFIPLSVLLGSG